MVNPLTRTETGRAILEVRSIASMASAHLDTVREKTSGAFWCNGLNGHITNELLNDAEQSLTEAEQELEKARAALALARQAVRA